MMKLSPIKASRSFQKKLRQWNYVFSWTEIKLTATIFQILISKFFEIYDAAADWKDTYQKNKLNKGKKSFSEKSD